MKKYLTSNKFLNIYKWVTILFLSIFCMGIFIGYRYNYKIETLALGQSETFYNIFKNNFIVGISLISVGSLTGGVYSILAIGINGYIVGQVCGYLMERKMLYLIIRGLLPHAVFEILGLTSFALISCIPTIYLFKWINNNLELVINPFKLLIKEVVNLFLLGTLLLIIAALIEAKISTVG